MNSFLPFFNLAHFEEVVCTWQNHCFFCSLPAFFFLIFEKNRGRLFSCLSPKSRFHQSKSVSHSSLFLLLLNRDSPSNGLSPDSSRLPTPSSDGLVEALPLRIGVKGRHATLSPYRRDRILLQNFDLETCTKVQSVLTSYHQTRPVPIQQMASQVQFNTVHFFCET